MVVLVMVALVTVVLMLVYLMEVVLVLVALVVEVLVNSCSCYESSICCGKGLLNRHYIDAAVLSHLLLRPCM